MARPLPGNAADARAGALTPGPSPLHALDALERSLAREHWFFSLLVGLLALVTLCAAAFAVVGLSTDALQRDGEQLRALNAQTNRILAGRYTLLTGARLLLSLGDEERLASNPAQRQNQGQNPPLPAPPVCTPAFAGLPADDALRHTCDATARDFQAVSGALPILLVRADGSAAYEYQPGDQPGYMPDYQPSYQPGAQPSSAALALFSLPFSPSFSPLSALPSPRAALPSGNTAWLLVAAAFEQMHARHVDPMRDPTRDPVHSADDGDVVWFHPPAGLGLSLGLDPHQMLGVSVALRNGEPYALAFTRVDPSDWVRATAAGAPTLVGADGTALAGPLTDTDVRVLERRIAGLPGGHFHRVQNYGWVYRTEPLALGFGHYLLVRSWGEHLREIGGPLALVGGATLALIALLLAMAYYWNRRFLTRPHAEAARALEGELVNHLLVHVTPVGLCIVRARDFEIVVANRIARTVLGLPDADTHLPGRLCASLEAHRLAMLRTGAQIFQCVFSPDAAHGTHEHGSEHLEITCSPAVLNREDVLFCAIADMSTHYEAAQSLREARQTSEAAARAKVSFFAAMSHEIRTPLASLVGNIELLGTAPLTAEQAARVRSMQASASGLLQIVNDVLDFSKMDVGEMRLVTEWGSITDLLERIVIAHAPLAVRQGLQYYVVLDRAIPSRLRFDPVRVAQIVNNLLGNAFKFTHSGKIAVEARWVGERLEIVVTDSGIGIAPELQARLFQPFTQGEGQRLTQTGSTGLGLSICARLCELMHGRVALESAVGVGTRITVELPLAIAPGSGAAGDAWTLPVPPEASATILCRASEYRAWLTNLFDATASVRILSGATPDDQIDPNGSANPATGLANLAGLPGSPRLLSLPGASTAPPGERDYLLVTDEFTLEKVLCLWGSSHNVIWVRQDGPLVPIRRDDGSIEVTIYSPASILAAVEQLDRPSSFAARMDEENSADLAAQADGDGDAASVAPAASDVPAAPEQDERATARAAPPPATREPERAWLDTRAAHEHFATPLPAISTMRAQHARGAAPRILIAEDNLLNRELLRDQLCTLGADVTEASDGKQALALLLDAAPPIDAVLTDVDMPAMNGFELLDAIRPAHPGLPVYAISASARPEDIAHGRARGFTDYLSKPVPLAVLAAVLGQTGRAPTATDGEATAADVEPAAQPEPGLPEPEPASETENMTPADPELEPDDDAQASIPRFPPLQNAWRNAFVTQCAQDLAALAPILDARDRTQLRRWAHRVAGGLAVLGPSMLHEFCEELRAHVRETDDWNDETSELARAFGEELAEMQRCAQRADGDGG